MEKNDNTPFRLDAQFTSLTKVTPTISKGRVKIFYKYDNRNNVYFSDEAAKFLASTLPYTPVVGVYAAEKNDFEEHKEDALLVKRAYGVVPENPNSAWEEVTEQNGTIKKYLTADVFLWTSRYSEANKIIGKKQSMELDTSTMRGKWFYKNGTRVYDVEQAHFSALCVLGDDKEPCFESAAFYIEKEDKDSIKEDLNFMFRELKELLSDQNKPKGGKEMDYNVMFKLYHDDIRWKLFEKLNPINSDGQFEFNYGIAVVTNNYAVIHEYASDMYYRLPYTTSEQDLAFDLESMVKVTFVDMTEEEEKILSSAKMSYETMQVDFELLKTEKEELVSQVNKATEEFVALQNEKTQLENELQSEKGLYNKVMDEFALMQDQVNEINHAKKIELVKAFSELLGESLDEEEVVKNMDKYTFEHLKEKLAVKVVEKKIGVKTAPISYSLVPNNGGSQKEDWEALILPPKNK